jgi:hypothetical protein
VAQVHRQHIRVELLHFAARSQKEQVKLSNLEPISRREACRRRAQHAKFVTADEEGRGKVRQKA